MAVGPRACPFYVVVREGSSESIRFVRHPYWYVLFSENAKKGRKNELNRTLVGEPTGQQGVTVMTLPNPETFSQLSLQANPRKLVICTRKRILKH